MDGAWGYIGVHLKPHFWPPDYFIHHLAGAPTDPLALLPIRIIAFQMSLFAATFVHGDQ